MANDWIGHLEKGSVSVSEIKKHISSLNSSDQELLHELMTKIVSECPSLELLPAKGFAPFSFHIKIPGTERLAVMAAVHPQKRNGVRFMSRRSLTGYVKNTDPQLKWQGHIKSSSDIDIALRYLKGVA